MGTNAMAARVARLERELRLLHGRQAQARIRASSERRAAVARAAAAEQLAEARARMRRVLADERVRERNAKERFLKEELQGLQRQRDAAERPLRARIAELTELRKDARRPVWMRELDAQEIEKLGHHLQLEGTSWMEATDRKRASFEEYYAPREYSDAEIDREIARRAAQKGDVP